MGLALGWETHRAVCGWESTPVDSGFEQKVTAEICHSEPRTSCQRPEAMTYTLGITCNPSGRGYRWTLEGLIQNPPSPIHSTSTSIRGGNGFSRSWQCLGDAGPHRMAGEVTQASGEKVSSVTAACHVGDPSPETSHARNGGVWAHTALLPLFQGMPGDPVMSSIVSGWLSLFCSLHVYQKLRSRMATLKEWGVGGSAQQLLLSRLHLPTMCL